MAEFELLKAKITVEFTQVNRALTAVRRLQQAVRTIQQSTIRLNVSDQARQTTAVNNATQQQLRIQRELLNIEKEKQRVIEATARAQRASINASNAQRAASQSISSVLKQQEAARQKEQARQSRMSQFEFTLARLQRARSAEQQRLAREQSRLQEKAARDAERSLRRQQQAIAKQRTELRQLGEGWTKLGIDIASSVTSFGGFTVLTRVLRFLRAGFINAIRVISGTVKAILALPGPLKAVAVGFAAAVVVAAPFALAIGALVIVAGKAAIAIGSAGLSAALRILKGTMQALIAPTRALITELQKLLDLRGMLGFASAMLNSAAAMERFQALFRFTFGAGAQQEFTRIRELADRFGFSLEEVANRFARFAAAANQSGIALKDIRDTFEGVMASGRVFGIDDHDIQGILTALEQIASKGKVMSEEIRRQLANRLPAAFALTAKSMGITQEELGEQMEKGQIKARQFFAVFGQSLKKTFMAQADTLAGSILAKLGRLRTLIFDIRVAIGTMIAAGPLAIIEKIVKTVRPLTAAFEAMRKEMVEAGQALAETFEAESVQVFLNQLAGNLKNALPSLRQFGFMALRVGAFLNAVLIGALARIDIILEPLNRHLASLITKFKLMTGFHFGDIEDAFTLAAAVIDQMPLIVERLANSFKHLIRGARNIGAVIAKTFRDIGRALTFMFPPLFFINKSLQLMARLIGAIMRETKDRIAAEFEGIATQIAESQRKFEAELEAAKLAGDKVGDKVKDNLGDAGREFTKEIGEAGKSELLDPLEFSKRILAANVVSGDVSIQKQELALVRRTTVATESLVDIANRLTGKAEPTVSNSGWRLGGVQP